MNITTPASIRVACIFVMCVLFGIGTVASAEAPYGENGWTTLFSENLGDDTSCGAGKVRMQLYLLEVGTENPVSVDSAVFTVYDLDSYDVLDTVTGVGPEVGSVCFNPETDRIGYDVDGGTGYHDFSIGWYVPNHGAVTRDKLYRTTVWLTPTSAAEPEHAQVSPINVTVNTSPEYKVNLTSFPATYGATGKSAVFLTISDYDILTGEAGDELATYWMPTSGGVGMITLPAQTLSDGVYTWGFYIYLNGSHSLGGFSALSELNSGRGGNLWPFTLDTTAPTITATNTPLSPYHTETVSFSATSTDALSGVDRITFYIDGVLGETCEFASVSSATCNMSAGPFSTSTTHSYYVVATDAAGNSATTSTNNFSVTSLPDLIAASTTVSVASVNAGESITFRVFGTRAPLSCGWPTVTYAGFYVDANNDGVSEYTAPVVATIAPNCASLRGNATWVVPANALSGTYRVGYIVNDPAVVAEPTYTNNWSGWTLFTVVGNAPPTASAGGDKDITLPTDDSAPTGVSVSDTDGSIASTVWSFVSGPGPTPTIVGETTLSPTFQGLSTAGTYTFRLTVIDNLGATTTDDMQVVVNEDPAPTGWITATPNVVDAVDTSTITWGSTNALGCDVSNTQNDDDWSGTSNATGEVTTPLTVNTSYVLTCDGVLVASAPITVNPDVTITASSKVVQSGGYVDITWNTNGNDEAACNLSGGGLTDTLFNGTGTGTHRVPDITAKTTFTITCGTQTDAIDVEVKPIGWES
jgi:hypothetical protein